jgi:class 3 adenylate cyclase/predicted ATPase
MICPACGTENEPGRKFCLECGTALARRCEACGAPNAPAAKFCGECGAALTGQTPGATAGPAPTLEPPTAERRLVSVLFADLVGFTSLSESRDPEEVRELLSGYFETSRRVIARYGGTVEKFIGDAVMAVWGTPVAQEDDAERAVRAGLELAAAVTAMGQEVGAPDLRARVGVLTGEAAVTLGAEGQGMVAGDLVNTASRIQSVAEPGQVLVGETTMRVTQVSVAYEDAGLHELKGKGQPLALWRAIRVVAGVGGAMKSEGLEAPFVGRDSELRMVKDLFHASADEGKAHLVSIVGIAGIGKSRLSWEFYKYFDGLREVYRWHRGRCLAHGDGVTYWALAEMVRGRVGIEEGEDAASSRTKLRATVEEFVSDPEERGWIEQRLAHLLGLEEREARDRTDLFAGWRLFFERIAERDPVVMAFEDMQWADAALLDFVEYLIEWSRNHPIFVITMARPELLDRRPTWGAGRRNFTSLFLEPLPAEAMRDLLRGLVPGLPGEVEEKILERAEGVPLYAVETVRMLLDRGALIPEGNAYRPAGPIDTLEVPESLHALIAARLDGLSQEERRLLQDASVLGKTFTRDGIAALSGTSEDALEPLLASLVRKEVLGIQTDPRSSERGQIGFLQDLVKRVAYETLSKRDRRERHLAVAAYLGGRVSSGEEDLVEVVASHYVSAYEAMPDAPDAPAIKDQAREALREAGERAAALAGNDAAERYFVQASEIADDDLARAQLLERAGSMAHIAGRDVVASQHFTAAIELFEKEGSPHDAARASTEMADVDWSEGRLQEALDRLESALPLLSSEDPDEDFAALVHQLARMHYFKGELDEAGRRVEQALEIAELHAFHSVIAHGLITKSLVLDAAGRPEESKALLKHALEIALEHGEYDAIHRAYNNLASLLGEDGDQVEAATEYARRGYALALKLGMGWNAMFVGGKLSYFASLTGDWDEAIAIAEELRSKETDEGALTVTAMDLRFPIMSIWIHRGDVPAAVKLLEGSESLAGTENLDWRVIYRARHSELLLAQGRPVEALAMGQGALSDARALGRPFERGGFEASVEAALQANEPKVADEIVGEAEALYPGQRSRTTEAQAARFRARLLAAQGRTGEVEPKFEEATALFRAIGFKFWLAVTLLEHGEWLVEQGRADEATPLLDEAEGIFENLRARPWLERLATALPQRQVAPA